MIFVPPTLDLLHFKNILNVVDLKVLYHNKKKSSTARQFVSLEKSRRLFSMSNAWNREKKKEMQSWRREEKNGTHTYDTQPDVMHSELSNERSVTDGAVSVLMREFSFPWILPLIFIFFFCIFSRSRLSALNRAKPQKWVPIHTHCNCHCYCCLHLSVWCVWLWIKRLRERKRVPTKMQCGQPKTSTRPDTGAQMN